jgi:hypothetical protein
MKNLKYVKLMTVKDMQSLVCREWHYFSISKVFKRNKKYCVNEIDELIKKIKQVFFFERKVDDESRAQLNKNGY